MAASSTLLTLTAALVGGVTVPRFGLGTTTPGALLHISGSSTSFALTDNDAVPGSKNWIISNNDGMFQIGTSSDDFSASSTPFITMSSSSVGIGNTAPVARLHVGSAAITDGFALLRLQDSNSVCDFNANAGGATCGSDRTLKKDITTIGGSLSKLTLLRPTHYHWRTEDSNAPLQTGFIAQEVAEVYPEFVTERQWVDGTRRKFLNVTGMVPYIADSVIETSNVLKQILETGTSTSTSTPFLPSEHSVWHSLVEIAHSFVDGVLTLSGFKADTVTTKTLCVGDESGGETCITKAQLDALLYNAARGGSAGTGGPSNNPSPTPTPDPSPTPTGSTTPDNEAPVLQVSGGSSVDVGVGAPYTDGGVSVSDNVDTSLTYTVSVDGGVATAPNGLSLDTAAAGTHTLTYSATDTAGNTGTVSRTVHIVAPAPVPEPTPSPEPTPTPESQPAP